MWRIILLITNPFPGETVPVLINSTYGEFISQEACENYLTQTAADSHYLKRNLGLYLVRITERSNNQGFIYAQCLQL